MTGPGFGLGLRPPFYSDAAAGQVPVDWFELTSENFMVAGGKPLRVLESVRQHYPVALHGVSLNLGGADALDADYLHELAALVQRAEPLWVSDHLCWTRQGEHYLHDLLPLPYTEEVVEHVAHRIGQVQDRLGRRILIENVTSYLEFDSETLPEWEFLSAVAERADCLILLDVNNVFVSAHNHGFDPRRYLEGVPAARVRQIHLAGHSASGPLLIDTHDHPIADAVRSLYGEAVRRFGQAAVMIERDDNYPPLAELVRELDRARAIRCEVLAA
ncbi:MAG: DUF692 domain-containing protein [Thermoanaerobaculia bacterium]